VPKLVHFAHRFIEDGRDNSSVCVAGRSGVTLAQPKTAHEAIALFVVAELQVHAFGVIPAASEAIILLQADVARIVAMGGRLFRHTARFYRG
jgi:hypothetical protein